MEVRGLLDLGRVFQRLPPGWQLPTGLTEQLWWVGDPGVLEDLLALVVVAGAGVVLLHLLFHLLHLRDVGLVQPSQKPNAIINRTELLGLTIDWQWVDNGLTIGQ